MEQIRTLLEQVRAQLSEQNAKLDAVDKQLDRQNDELGLLSKRTSSLEVQDAGLCETVDRLSGLIDGNGREGYAERLKGMEQNIAQLERRTAEDRRDRKKFMYWVAGLGFGFVFHMLVELTVFLLVFFSRSGSNGN